MEIKTLFIKNMVCNRCILAVQTIFEGLGFQPKIITLGKVTLIHPITSTEQEQLKTQLTLLGFELLEDKKSRLVENIKGLIIELIQEENNHLSTTLSHYLSKKLQYDYNYLSNLFSKSSSKTIEQFYINQKIEKVKELLTYGELSVKEIAYQLHYSSVAHLSQQFKKITGLTTTQFKQNKEKRRKSIDKL